MVHKMTITEEKDQEKLSTIWAPDLYPRPEKTTSEITNKILTKFVI